MSRKKQRTRDCDDDDPTDTDYRDKRRASAIKSTTIDATTSSIGRGALTPSQRVSALAAIRRYPRAQLPPTPVPGLKIATSYHYQCGCSVHVLDEGTPNEHSYEAAECGFCRPTEQLIFDLQSHIVRVQVSPDDDDCVLMRRVIAMLRNQMSQARGARTLDTVKKENR